jgi:hypothetical protein
MLDWLLIPDPRRGRISEKRRQQRGHGRLQSGLVKQLAEPLEMKLKAKNVLVP